MISSNQKTLFANLISYVHSQDNSSMDVLIDSRGTIILYCNYFTPEVVNNILKLIGSRYYNIRYYQQFDHMTVSFCILDD